MTPFDIPLWFVIFSLFILGAVFGSFLNVCVYRIPRHDDLWSQLRGLSYPPSSCPNCRKRISRGDNVPILGWLMLLGRCRNCRAPISARYPLVELFNGLLFVLVYWYEIPHQRFGAGGLGGLDNILGPQIVQGMSAVAWLHWRYAYHMVLLEALLVASLIDYDLKIIPDASTLPAMAIGLIGSAACAQMFLVPVWFQDAGLVREMNFLINEGLGLGAPFGGPSLPEWIRSSPRLHGVAVSLAGLLVGGGIVWGIRLIGFWVLRQEAMGFGDVILMALIGSFLGWQPTVVVFFLAPVGALAVVLLLLLARGLDLLGRKVLGRPAGIGRQSIWQRVREIPYGPYLSLGALTLLLFWQTIWPVARRFFDLGPVLIPVVIFGTILLTLCLLLMQGVKWLLGIPLYPEAWVVEWTAGDQLAFFANNKSTPDLANWKKPHRWPGELSGAGTLHTAGWKQPPSLGYPGRTNINRGPRTPGGSR